MSTALIGYYFFRLNKSDLQHGQATKERFDLLGTIMAIMLAALITMKFLLEALLTISSQDQTFRTLGLVCILIMIGTYVNVLTDYQVEPKAKLQLTPAR